MVQFSTWYYMSSPRSKQFVSFSHCSSYFLFFFFFLFFFPLFFNYLFFFFFFFFFFALAPYNLIDKTFRSHFSLTILLRMFFVLHQNCTKNLLFIQNIGQRGQGNILLSFPMLPQKLHKQQ